MVGWLLAGLPPDVLMGQALTVGFVLALACVCLAGVKRRAARRLVAGKQKTKPTRDPTIVLGFLALILGPALGAHLAVLHNWFFEVNSLDHLYNVWTFTIIGGFAGFLLSCACAVTSLPRQTNPIGKPDQKNCDSEFDHELA
jgi:hypothetical protein